MNTSFSKRRHILEANLVAEKRFLGEKEDKENLVEQSVGEVISKVRKQLTNFNTNEEVVLGYLKSLGNAKTFMDFLKAYDDNATKYKWNSFVYDLNRAFSDSDESKQLIQTLSEIGIKAEPFVKDGRYSYKFTPIDSSVPDGNATSPASTAKKTLQYKDCSKATSFGYLCADTRPEEQNPIKKVQRCLGLKKVDGYFGGDTLKALNDKFADKKGVFTINDVATICQTKPSGSAYQAEDSEINPAIATQTQPEVVTPAQSLQPKQGAQVKSQQQIAAPKIQISAQQRDRLSKEWQTQVEKVKGENPGLNNQEIVNLLASRGIKYPEALRQQPVRA
jgi:hypothetical protein